MVDDTLIRALQNVGVFEHPVENLEVIETHISWVILTGDFAYKIKKPVDFGFLNFTGLSQRKQFCEAELTLNRRLAKEIYLELVPIYGTRSQPSFEAAGDPIEYAIKMRQFPQQNLFDHLLADGKLSAEDINALTDQLAQFHQQIEIADDHSSFGHPEQVHAPVKQNFEQIRPLLHHAEDLAQLEKLEHWAEKTFKQIEPLLAQRKNDGFIRACHGDVHLGNIVMFRHEPRIFDGIEFNEDFRWIDVASELAFLAMDLMHRGQSAFAFQAISRYLEKTGDFEVVRLLPYYLAYRAMVRAKIALLSIGPDPSDDQAETCQQNYLSYSNLSESFIVDSQPFLIMMHGVSATGKTTVAEFLIEQLGAIRIRSDVERKRLFGEQTASGIEQGIYQSGHTEETYQRLAKLCEMILTSGFPVVVDAAFLKENQRRLFIEMATKLGARWHIVSCHAPQDIIQSWLHKRHELDDNVSDADLEVIQNQIKMMEIFSELESDHSTLLDTSQIFSDTGEVLTLAPIESLIDNITHKQPLGVAV